MTLQDSHQPLLRDLAAFFAKKGVSAWLVGGTVRDLLLGRAGGDIDLAVDGDGLALARSFANKRGGAFVALDAERRTGRVVFGAGRPVAADELHDAENDGTDPPAGRVYLDIATLRGTTIEEDLRKRDFTINALALPLQEEPSSVDTALIDPCGGLIDLQNRMLRACSDESLRDDPLRLLRGLRLAAMLGLQISEELDSQMRRDASLITGPAAERVRDEMMRLLGVAHVAPWLRYMDDLGVLTCIFPELEAARGCDQPSVHFLPVLAHSLEAVAAVDWMLERLYMDGGRRTEDGGRRTGDENQERKTGTLEDSGIGRQETSSESVSSILGLRSPVLGPYPPDDSRYTTVPLAVQAYPELDLELAFGEQLREHFKEQVGGFPRQALFKLAALLHDNAKPQTRQIKPDGGVSFYDHQVIGANVAKAIAQRLRLTRAAVGYVSGVVRAHMRPGQLGTQPVTLRAVLRLFRDTGGTRPNSGAYGPDVLLHAMADHMATRGPQISVEGWQTHIVWTSALLEVYWGQPATPPPPLVTGNDLMVALGIEPGARVGELLREVREAHAAGEITTREEALELARQLYSQPEL